MSTHIGGHALPSLDEYQHGATTAILRLQRTYALETTDLAAGLIRGVTSAEGLDRHDCYMLGITALEKADYGQAAQWLTLAAGRDGPLDDGGLSWIDAITRLIETHQKVGIRNEIIVIVIVG